MGLFDQSTVKNVGFQADFAGIAVVFDGPEDGGPVEQIGADDEGASLHLDVVEAGLGQQGVAFGEGFALAVHFVHRVPVDAEGLGGDEFAEGGEFGAVADVAGAFVFDEELDAFGLGEAGHGLEDLGDAGEEVEGLGGAGEGKDADFVDVEGVGGADGFAEFFHAIGEAGFAGFAAAFEGLGGGGAAEFGGGSGQVVLEHGGVEEGDAEVGVLEGLDGGAEVAGFHFPVVGALAGDAAEFDPLDVVLVGEGDGLFGGAGDFVGEEAEPGPVDAGGGTPEGGGEQGERGGEKVTALHGGFRQCSSSGGSVAFAKKAPIAAEAGDAVKDGFHAGGDGDGKNQSGAAPDQIPDHQSDGDDQGIEVDAAADEFGIEQVEGDHVEQGHDGADDEVGGPTGIDRECGDERGEDGQRESDIGDQTQEAAHRAHDLPVGDIDEPEDQGADDGEHDAKQEVADDVGAGNGGDALPGALDDIAFFALDEIHEAAAEVVAPTQEEVDEEGDERGHQDDVIEAAEVGKDGIDEDGAFGADADFLDFGFLREGKRGFDDRAAAFGGGFAGGFGLFAGFLGGGFGVADALGNEEVAGGAFDLFEADGGGVDEVGEALGVGGEGFEEADSLRPGAETGEVKRDEHDGAGEETGAAAGDLEAHEEADQGFEDEGEQDGGDEGNEEEASNIQDENDKDESRKDSSGAPGGLRRGRSGFLSRVLYRFHADRGALEIGWGAMVKRP